MLGLLKITYNVGRIVAVLGIVFRQCVNVSRNCTTSAGANAK